LVWLQYYIVLFLEKVTREVKKIRLFKNKNPFQVSERDF